MVRIGCRTVLVLGAVIAVWPIGSTGALAAGGLAPPQLRWPEGKAVPTGHARLRVYVPDPGVVINGKIFLVITNKRKVRGGLLQIRRRCADTCTIVIMHRRSAHLWTYRDSFSFPGLWDDTPGTYYWQAYYYPNTGVLGVVPSRVGSFRIT